MMSRREIAAMRTTIAPHIRRTPVVDVGMETAREPVSLKLETLQHTGSFKARGAFANLVGTTVPPAGVTAASGGNHGAAVAYAASVMGSAARIFVPETSPPAKVARIRSYGAEVVVAGATYVEALALSKRHAADSGALAVHAYDASPTIMGQATIALEFEDERPDLDTVLVAVGGGGLIAGVAAWYASGTRIVGVETEGCPTLAEALAAGRPVDIAPTGIARDSLGASRLGDLSFEIASRHVRAAVLVRDADVAAAQGWLWDKARVVAEPGGATAVAAMLSGVYRAEPGERVGVIICGANVDLDGFAAATPPS
jgi:threonine dehydratase